MKRLLSIQDISCFGKCSQTVALPIISALGIETVILPTAILSTHTGNFKDYSFLSLSEEMQKITRHWKSINLSFDAIYIGYIGTYKQVRNISTIIDMFRTENTLVYVDPAMADNAKLYSRLDLHYSREIIKLCQKADIICPNMYEAMLLSGKECKSNYTINDIEPLTDILKSITKKVIITGIHNDEEIVTIGYDSEQNLSQKKVNKKFDGMFYGTGDIFASTFIGAYLNGLDFFKSIDFADSFVQKCIEATIEEKDKYWYGINYEQCLSYLTDFIKNLK